jgi:hypothetical protein
VGQDNLAGLATEQDGSEPVSTLHYKVECQWLEMYRCAVDHQAEPFLFNTLVGGSLTLRRMASYVQRIYYYETRWVLWLCFLSSPTVQGLIVLPEVPSAVELQAYVYMSQPTAAVVKAASTMLGGSKPIR